MLRSSSRRAEGACNRAGVQLQIFSRRWLILLATEQALLSARAEKTIGYNQKVKDAGAKTQEALSELTNKYKEDVESKRVRSLPAGPVHFRAGERHKQVGNSDLI